MGYAVILGKNRRQLQAVLRLPSLQKDARWLLGAYSKGDEFLDADAAILLRLPDGQWALLCSSFSPSPFADELRSMVMPLSRGLKVVMHSEFVRDRKWQGLIKKYEDT